MAKKILNSILKGVHARLQKHIGRNEYPLDFSQQEIETIRLVQPYTMTSPERIFSLINAVNYIVRGDIGGSIVECGVWRGGSMMAAAKTLISCGCGDREIYLFDTFEGMSEPSEKDVSVTGKSAIDEFKRLSMDGNSSDWCLATREDVERNMSLTGYRQDMLRFVKGKVEETIPDAAPERIALLRLDTDWYESTLHELRHLYPRIAPGGVLIIDDYGHWRGARQATDEYFAEIGIPILLNRVDVTGRIAVKPHIDAAQRPKQ